MWRKKSKRKRRGGGGGGGGGGDGDSDGSGGGSSGGSGGGINRSRVKIDGLRRNVFRQHGETAGTVCPRISAATSAAVETAERVSPCNRRRDTRELRPPTSSSYSMEYPFVDVSFLTAMRLLHKGYRCLLDVSTFGSSELVEW
ncbi:hypothetical protein V1478_013875 [Vespula squamosa]|uniref:Uncharacterized protein n=1 Tax=Vespula squamosa TaxID=30214 RepID=A0ABD2A6F9_VESSQ